jgi:hypothetical protein
MINNMNMILWRNQGLLPSSLEASVSDRVASLLNSVAVIVLADFSVMSE